MDLLYGNSPKNSLIITVISVSSLGPLINHSDNPNCASLRCVINKEPKIIIYTLKSIKVGEQLTYSYNSGIGNYPTGDFIELND